MCPIQQDLGKAEVLKTWLNYLRLQITALTMYPIFIIIFHLWLHLRK